MSDNKTKDMILDRLFDYVGVYSNGGVSLPSVLNTDDVLKAINLDEFFFEEAKSEKKEQA